MKKLFLLLAVAGIVIACNKDDGQDDPLHHPGKGVFVTNEGTFQQENASLTYYNPANGKAEQEVCYRANNMALGDVCQSMTISGRKGFVVVNNSGRVAVIDTDNFKYIGEIRNLTSPRYVLPVSDDKIYISDMYSREITIANPNTCEKTGTIDMGGGDGIADPLNSSERMVKYGNHVFVCSYSYNNRVFKIDAATNRIVGTIELDHRQPQSIVVDNEGYLWILSDGGYPPMAGLTPEFFTPTKRALTRINAVEFDYANATVFEFPADDFGNFSVSDLAINGAKDRIYFLSMDWNLYSGGVFAMSITDDVLPAEPLISGNFYALEVDPGNNDIYVSESFYDSSYQPLNGKAYRYDLSGTLLDEFDTGIFPGGFCFKPE